MSNIVFLAGFPVLKPDPGLIFWTTIVFILVYFILWKKGFGSIQEALKKREHDIQDALDAARKAKIEMENLNEQNQSLLTEAREERSKILKDAKDIRTSLIEKAKVEAKEEANKIMANAKLEIDNQKKAAISEIKSQVGVIALEIAEKVLKEKLKSDSKQEDYVNKLVDEIKFN